MAELKFKYREGKCTNYCFASDYIEQCQTDAAYAYGCEGYCDGNTGSKMPFGNCIFAEFDYKYKGISAKNYECEYYEDVYNPHLNCILLTVGKKKYECVQLFIDGAEAFPGLLEDE